MIRILTNEFHPRTGGIATYSLELAKALTALGQEVVVACPAADGVGPDFPFKHEPFSSRGSQDPDDVWRLARVLRRHLRETPAASLFLTEPAPLKALLLAQGFLNLSRSPLWITFHGSELARLVRNGFWRQRLRRLGPSVDRFVVNSQYTRQLLLGHFPEWEERVAVVLPAVPEDWKGAFPQEKPVTRDAVRLLTVARLHPRKGQLEVIEALSSISAEKGIRLSYQIVGAARRDAWQKKIAAAQITCPYEVELSGALAGTDLRAAFAEADIFVMASRPDPLSIESFGIVYLEAAAAGLPVIAADVGGVSEAVKAGESALLIPPGDPQALREAILQLARDPEKRRAMGAAGRQFAAGFSWETSAKALLQ